MFRIPLYTAGFCILDYIFHKMNVKGVYYLLHAINNGVVVHECYRDVLTCYLNFSEYTNSSLPNNCIYMTISLHLYHIIVYKNSLRFDDWLHHILMIGIIMPLVGFFHTGGIIVSHGMFYTTGLPGGIDYTLLFLNRNNIIVSRKCEKYINTILNAWIRCPGCIITSVFVLIMTQSYKNIIQTHQLFAAWCIIIILYWNGVYFMKDVLRNYYSYSLHL